MGKAGQYAARGDAHFVSKCAECAEILREEYLTLRLNEGITDMGFIKWMFKLE